MNKHYSRSCILISISTAVSILFFLACSKAEKKENVELCTPEMLQPKEISFLSSRGFIEEKEKIIYLYHPTKISKGGILLTDKRVIVYDTKKEEHELLENIFDLSSRHAVSAEKKSTITLYRKNDSNFSYAFPGGTTIDETFFSALRETWRSVLSKKQETDDTDTATGGVFLGIKKKEEKENNLKLR